MWGSEMKKCMCLLLTFVIFSNSALLASEDTLNAETDELPKNTIVIDIVPAFLGLIMGIVLADEDSAISIGIGAHYERDLSDKMSLSGRFGYFMLNTQDNDFFWKVSAMSAQGHFRYYPYNQRAFFFDGMLGYGNFFTESSGIEKVWAHYFLAGAKIGWRIDFGRPGGFVVEPAFYLSGAFGPDKDFSDNEYLPWINPMYNEFARALVTGLGVSLGFGYRF